MHRTLSAFISFIAFTVVGMGLQAQTPSVARRTGEIQVASVTGQVYLGGTPRVVLAKGSRVSENQIVNTGPNSSTVLVFSNGATINLAADSQLSIEEFLQDPFSKRLKISDLAEEPTTSTTKLNLIRGELLSNVKTLHRESGSEFQVQTPVGAAGIRGTTFRVQYRPQGARATFGLTLVEGLIRLALNGNRPVEVATNKEVILSNISIDPATQTVVSIPIAGAPSDVSLATQAALAQSVQEAIGAASTVTFEATSSPTVSNPPAPGTPGAEPATPEEAAASAAIAASSPMPAPPIAESPPRTSPSDGAP